MGRAEVLERERTRCVRRVDARAPRSSARRPPGGGGARTSITSMHPMNLPAVSSGCPPQAGKPAAAPSAATRRPLDVALHELFRVLLEHAVDLVDQLVEALFDLRALLATLVLATGVAGASSSRIPGSAWSCAPRRPWPTSNRQPIPGEGPLEGARETNDSYRSPVGSISCRLTTAAVRAHSIARFVHRYDIPGTRRGQATARHHWTRRLRAGHVRPQVF